MYIRTYARFRYYFLQLLTPVWLANIFTPFEITLQCNIEHLFQSCERFIRYLCDRSDFESCIPRPKAD